jgi:non-specific serine/threonine protein kinase
MDNLPPLWKHQLEGIELGKKYPDCALLFEMGTGKTRTALEILRARMNENKKILRTLIIGPAAVLYNWRAEIAKYTKIPLDKVFVLDGSVAERIKLIKVLPKDSIFITNYEGFANAKMKEIFTYAPPEFLILDEAHRVKGVTAQRTKALTAISDAMNNLPVHYRMILTGTPVLNNEMDLFAQYRILDGGKRLGKNFFQFRAQYFEDKNRYMPKHAHFPKWVVKTSSRDILKAKISEISIHASKDECLDLPPLVRVSVPVELSAEQKRAYSDMKKEFLAVCENGVSIAQLAITKALRMQQILSGFLKLDNGEIHRFEVNPRAKALKDLLEDIASNHKVIVWSIFHEDHEIVRNACRDLELEYAELTGLISDKQAEIDKFQNQSSCRVMIASQAAGGTGVNLTEASYMVYFSRGYSLEHDLQSEARAYRGGSEKHTSITRIDLVAEGTIDTAVLKALQDKKDLSTDILHLAKMI